ncbi:MAG: trypsin-like serine protease [Bacteroidetes bacterium]|nr:trypsin-like serine protease [Bacteroidota bacterium]
MDGPRNDHDAHVQRRGAGRKSRRVLAKGILEAARSYAASVGTDDETYVRAFLTALNAAADMRETGGARRFDFDTQGIIIPSLSLLSHAQYAANARGLYCTANHAAIGGRAARPSEHRECIAIGSNAGLRGGVLVSANAVLTTAHAVCDEDDLHVLIGRALEHPERTLRVRRVLPHPAYDAAGNASDLALLVLEEELNGLPVARMAPPDAVDTATEVRLVGFGNSNVQSSISPGLKRMLHVPVVSVDCRGAKEHEAFRCVPGLELVVGRPALACEGCSIENGSPCYVRSGNRWCLAGIASRPIPGYHSPGGDGGIYGRVDGGDNSWIRSTTGLQL